MISLNLAFIFPAKLFVISVSDTTCPDDYYTTIEEQDLFIQCYPHVVDEFNVTQEEKKTKKSSKGMLKGRFYFSWFSVP